MKLWTDDLRPAPEYVVCKECTMWEDCENKESRDGCYFGEKNTICQWCFEEPALEGKSMCQACIDAASKKEDDDFDLDTWLEGDKINGRK